MQLVSKNRGQTLVGVLITAAIAAIVMLGFLSMFKSQIKATRNIAALGGVADLSHGLEVLFGSPQCASVGTYLNGGSPAIVSVSGSSYSLSLDTLNFANGSVAITSLPNTALSNMIQPYSIAGIRFTALGGNSATQYPFQMTVTFGGPSGPPPPPLNKFITIYTNASKVVVGACYNANATPATGSIDVITVIGGNDSVKCPATHPTAVEGGPLCGANVGWSMPIGFDGYGHPPWGWTGQCQGTPNGASSVFALCVK